MRFLITIFYVTSLLLGTLNAVQAARNSIVVGMQLEPPNLDPFDANSSFDHGGTQRDGD